MSLAIYPGSFDPLTLGHMDIITRAAQLFDRVVVFVMVNSEKEYTFSVFKLLRLPPRSTRNLPNVEIDAFNGMLADYCIQCGAHAVVRGLRVLSDFEYEFQMAITNNSIHPQMETIFLPANREYMFLSSSVVREIAHYGRDISALVPSEVADDIQMGLKGKG